MILFQKSHPKRTLIPLAGTCPCQSEIGGVNGNNMKGNYLSGKPRPVAGELHNLMDIPGTST